MQAIRLFTVLLVSFLFSATASAQVFDSGPSDSALFTNVFNLPGDVLPSEFSVGGTSGETTQLNFADDGSEGRIFRANAGGEVNISGGSVNSLDANEGSEINISGGSVGYELGRWFVVSDGSQVNISGGSVRRLGVNEGSEINISGGTLESLQANAASEIRVNISGGTVGLRANEGCEINISGGTVGVRVDEGSAVNISGGTLAFGFRTVDSTDVEWVGGEFKLNGETFTEPIITLGDNDVFTGTLADGSAFIFSDLSSDYFFGGARLTTPAEPLPEASLIPIVVTMPLDSGPNSLREGQSLTLQTGGELGTYFSVVDATLNVEGGEVKTGLEVARGIVNINGGSVGRAFRAFYGSEVNISGGNVEDSFRAFYGSEVNISGGSVGRHVGVHGVANISGGSVGTSFFALDGSEVNISGGSVGSLDGADGSVVNISGGDVAGLFSAFGGSKVNLIGSNFVLDGVSLDVLIPGEAFTILDRDVTLSCLLADGSAFSVDLNTFFDSIFQTQDYFSPSATLTVTLTEPEFLLGDCDQNGVVNLYDIAPFISILFTGDYLAEADINEDGFVRLSDIIPFIAVLSSSF